MRALTPLLFLLTTPHSLLTIAQAAEPVTLRSVDSACSTVLLYERCELTATLAGAITNPYNPNDVKLDAIFTPPQGQAVTVPGFYYEPFERVTREGRDDIHPSGAPVWKVRFTPRQPGRWSYQVSLTTPQGTQRRAPEPFLVAGSDHPGFVRFDRDHGAFQFDDGHPFIPIGENLCWGPSVQPLQAFQGWFRALSTQRANYIRMWMAPWMLRLETKETGVGRYDQYRAWLVDELLKESANAGLYWQLCLLNHGSFSQTQDPDWHNNPYNEKLGGMCRLPNAFLTDPHAQVMFERLLRYTVARWGADDHLVMWELFNEADFGEFAPKDLVSWLARMSAALQALDVNHRPITTSFHAQAPEGVWDLPNLDTIQWHVYDKRAFAPVFAGPEVAELRAKHQKPVFIGEFGWIDEVMRRFDDAGVHLHEGLWSSLMGGTGGGALIWYWDTYVHPNRLERHFRAAEAFWRDEQLGKAVGRMALTLSDPQLEGWGVGTRQRMFVWVKNRAHTLDAYITYRCEQAKARLRAARGQPVPPVAYAPTAVHGATATVTGADWMSRYRVEWWDTYRGKIIARGLSRSQMGMVTVDVPDVHFDLAAKVIKLQWWERG